MTLARVLPLIRPNVPPPAYRRPELSAATIMSFWGSKRRRGGDTMFCGDCGDSFDGEEDVWVVCGECERTLCEACSQTICPICEKSDFPISLAICEGCAASCDKCGDGAVYHKSCLTEHIKTCTARSRAERSLDGATRDVATKTTELAQAEAQLRRARERVDRLKRELSDARERRDAAARDAAAAADSVDD